MHYANLKVKLRAFLINNSLFLCLAFLVLVSSGSIQNVWYSGIVNYANVCLLKHSELAACSNLHELESTIIEACTVRKVPQACLWNGRKSIKFMDFQGAYAALSRYVRLQPSHSIAHYLLGQTLFELGLLGEATNEFNATGAGGRAVLNLARGAIRTGNDDVASAYYHMALVLSPTSGLVHYEVARYYEYYARSKDLDSALKHYRQALEHEKTGGLGTWERIDARLKVANIIFARDGDFEKAKVYLDEIQRLFPDHGLAHSRVAEYLSAWGHTDCALQVINEYLSRHPDDATALGTKAQLLYQLGEYSEAVKIAEIAIDKDGRRQPSIRLTLARALEAVEHFDKAETYYLQAVQFSGTNPAYDYALISFYLRIGQLDKARHWLQQAKLHFPNDSRWTKLAEEGGEP